MVACNSLLAEEFRSKAASMGYTMSQEATEDVGYKTGFLNFDFLNGYITEEFDSSTGISTPYFNLGLTDGAFVSFIGNTGTGKTTLVCQIAANIARQFPTTTIFEDNIEGGLTHKRRMTLSQFSPEEYRKRYIIRNTGVTIENFYKRISMIFDEKMKHVDRYLYDTGHKDMYGNPIMKLEPTIYIIDSIAMMMPEKFSEEDELSGNSAAAAAARVMAQTFRQIIPKLKAANIILIGINHILEDVQMSIMPKKNPVPYLKQGERMPKGRTITFLANNIVRVDNGPKLKEDEGYKVEGSVTEITLVKSRSSGIKTATRLIYDFANGFDPWLSLLQYLKDNKFISGAGVSLYLSDDVDKKYKFSYGTFRNKIIESEEFRKFFLNSALSKLKNIPKNRDVAAKELPEDLTNSLVSEDVTKY